MDSAAIFASKIGKRFPGKPLIIRRDRDHNLIAYVLDGEVCKVFGNCAWGPHVLQEFTQAELMSKGRIRRWQALERIRLQIKQLDPLDPAATKGLTKEDRQKLYRFSRHSGWNRELVRPFCLQLIIQRWAIAYIAEDRSFMIQRQARRLAQIR